ncbi:helix-turn-helix domain-containing protein, partial [Cypionkella sp.]
MGLLNIIRRMHLRQKLSIREIAQLTGVSRNTVRDQASCSKHH